MCKYCKRLKELSNLDRIEYERIIKDWKRRVFELEGLIHWLVLEIKLPSDPVLRDVLLKKADTMLSDSYVGK